VRLSPNRTEIDADGEDVAVFTVSVVDAHGLVVPTAGNKVSFALEGPGRIIGVGNGDPSCHEPDTVVTEAPTRSLPVDGWRWKKVADPYPENLPEESVGFDDSKWEKYDVRADSGGTLGYHDRGVFRTRFDVSAADLASSAVELVFGRLAGGITVYINGRKVGGTVDDRNAVAYDVKELLHSGENVIAVPMANYGPEPMGPCKGVTLRMQGMPPAPQWGRSVFNGLAEVIVKASREAGTIALTASAEGLASGTFSLKTQEADARPSVP
jgi:beta-galactosidase